MSNEEVARVGVGGYLINVDGFLGEPLKLAARKRVYAGDRSEKEIDKNQSIRNMINHPCW